MQINYKSPGGFFSSNYPHPTEANSTFVQFAHSEEGGFYVIPPPSVDWADYEDRPDDADGKPVPAVRHPRDPWTYYQQEYKIEGGQPTAEEVSNWEPPPPQPSEPAPVTDVEILYKTISERLNGDEAKRTGRPVDPNGAVPVTRAMAATAMLYQKWHYPSEADLSAGNNPAILAAIYADPTTNTNTDSSIEQKCKVLQFTLVMLAGQQFGLDYQAELGAYERTASGAFLSKLAEDQRDWLKLPCPKMHKDWPEFKSVLEMFQTLMK